MSMSTSVVGIVPPDEEWRRNIDAFIACRAAGVEPPDELYEKLGLDADPSCNPDPLGLIVCAKYGDDDELKAACEPWREDMREGFTIDLRKVPKRYKLIRVNSY